MAHVHIKLLTLLSISVLIFSCKPKQEITETKEQIETIEEVTEETEASEDASAVHENIESNSYAKNCLVDWNQKPRGIVSADQTALNALREITTGQIFILTKVNREGQVTAAKIDENNSTVTDKSIRRKVLAIVEAYIFEADPNAAKQECGTVKIYFDLK